jgi:hypothetical protein
VVRVAAVNYRNGNNWKPNTILMSYVPRVHENWSVIYRLFRTIYEEEEEE